MDSESYSDVLNPPIGEVILARGLGVWYFRLMGSGRVRHPLPPSRDTCRAPARLGGSHVACPSVLTGELRHASSQPDQDISEKIMILLDSRFCGYDLSLIGFPSVETCMAVVLETRDWLVGWHAMNTGGTAIANDATAFGGYVQKMGTSPEVRLYGVTHPSRMSATLLKAQMRTIAQKLNYNGRISVYLMPERRKPQQDYVQFTRIGGNSKCKVEYLDQQLVQHDEVQVVPAKTRHQQILNGKVEALSTRTIDDRTQQIVVSPTSPIRTSVKRGTNNMTLITDRNWTNFKA
jgi:hypothetical protein